MKKAFFPIIIVLCSITFFYKFLFFGLLPIPSDTIVGLYSPYRDYYSQSYPRGIPFKNFLLTDPVRQQYPWKNLVITSWSRQSLPIWNPYSGAGTPLLANFQSSPFYPLNILFFFPNFHVMWSIYILLQPLLAGVFLYFYLIRFNLSRKASLIGSIAFSFSGFSIAWMEWGVIMHTALWLPLILLSIDKIIKEYETPSLEFKLLFFRLRLDQHILWPLVLIFSLFSAFSAGHLQIFTYLIGFSFVYFFARWLQISKSIRTLLQFSTYFILFAILSMFQWLPTWQFILLSGRELDQSFLKDGWFLPWQNLIQFIAPDFFGNPSTLNYWGVFNYAEFVGYIGLIPLLFAFVALFSRRDKKTLFYGTALVVSLIFALPSFISELPFRLGIPLFSTAQPTRLIFISCFSLSVLSAFGFDYYEKFKKGIAAPILVLLISIISLWLFVILGEQYVNIDVARRNLVLPTIIFAFASGILIGIQRLKRIPKKYLSILLILFILITVGDLFRFGWKFLPFTIDTYLFPKTNVINFLKKDNSLFRISTTDSRIFPPNFSVIYSLQSIDVYDPLYLKRYAEFIAAVERGKPDIKPPFGFNRIITPHNKDSKLLNLLNVKYVLSYENLVGPRYVKVFEEGQTKIFENTELLPRAFFVNEVVYAKTKQDSINELFKLNLGEKAVIEEKSATGKKYGIGDVTIKRYAPNEVVINTENESDGFLVLSDVYYPSWRAYIDGKISHVFITNYTFRGIVVPKGTHSIRFASSLF